MPPIALWVVGLGIVWFLHRTAVKVAAQQQSSVALPAGPVVNTSSPPPSSSPSNTTPPIPSHGGATIVAPSWYTPKDDLDMQSIVTAQILTIRQIQTAYNMLSANLVVNGLWDLPTQQATWDFQYIHEKDNPQNLLNITADMDQATQNAIQTALTATPAAQAAHVKTAIQAYFG